jgi:hypothetical protein
MSIDQMRKAIVEVYPGERWEAKVDKMSDGQIIAIYHKFLYDGKFDRKPKTSNLVFRRKSYIAPIAKNVTVAVESGSNKTSNGSGVKQISFDDILRGAI